MTSMTSTSSSTPMISTNPMSTTYDPIEIGTVNGSPVLLGIGKGRNPSSVSFKGEKVSVGYTWLLGDQVEKIYGDWYDKNCA